MRRRRSPAEPYAGNPPDFEPVPGIVIPSHWLCRDARPAAVRYRGAAEPAFGILQGDYLLIERNRKPAPGDVVVLAESIGKRWLARYVETDKHVALVTSDLDLPIPILVRQDLRLWGVVCGVLRMVDDSVLREPPGI